MNRKLESNKNKSINRIKTAIKVFAVLASVALWGIHLNAQTCSCAGAPVFNPLEYDSMQEGKKWRFELSYKYHAINDLVEGSQQVNDTTDRHRSAQSVFLEVRYALTKRFSLIGLLNFTGHRRDVGISSSPAVTTQGLGDSMLAIQYSPILFSDGKKLEFSVGGGVKLPTGQSNLRNTGIAAEDMQPGTGSWDFMGWVYASHRVSFIRGLELFAGASFRYNGENDREYKFGNEIISAFGTRLKTRGFLDYSLYARYRWADSDQRFNGDVPNTGGNWIYIVPGVTFKIADSMGIKTEIEIPIYRKLNGFRQFTSTMQLSFSVFYEI